MANTRQKINRKSKKNKSKGRSVKKKSGGIKPRRRRVVRGGSGTVVRADDKENDGEGGSETGSESGSGSESERVKLPFNSVKMRKIGFYNYGKTEREKDTFKIGDKVDYYPDEKKVDKKKVDKKKVIHNCVVTEVYEKGKFSTGDPRVSCIVLFIMKPRLSLILQQISS